MPDKYISINIKTLLEEGNSSFIGEEKLKEILSDFVCPKNPDVEVFLHKNAIEFTKKNQSVTYLVFDMNTGFFVGYYAIAIKPIIVRAKELSKNGQKKLERIAVLDADEQSYSAAAYLIAQLGKNYALPKEYQITGRELLAAAMDSVIEVQYSIGGVVMFLECEDNPFLLNFYSKQNAFKAFDIRETNSPAADMEPRMLHQLLKFI